jgi:hypothetical protein
MQAPGRRILLVDGFPSRQIRRLALQDGSGLTHSFLGSDISFQSR